ncbi:FUSC family protein [Oceanospirillum sp. HFRX-1_2]
MSSQDSSQDAKESSEQPSDSKKQRETLWQRLRPLFELSNIKRPWGMLLTVSLSVGSPVLLGTLLGNFEAGIAASCGGLASIYLRQTPLSHRLITMALVTFGFSTGYLLVLLAGFSFFAVAAALAMVVFWATFICRFYDIPPPGSFFFIMVACIASAMPYEPARLAEHAGLLLFGCLGASFMTLLYSLIQKLKGELSGLPQVEVPEPRVVAIVLEAGTLAVIIAFSYLLAIALGFEKPYWVPISCAAVLQGASFRVVWHRKIHRIVGTLIGLGLAWVIFRLDPGHWEMAFLVLVLSFVIEVLVTRNYGLAVIFITPMTIILAEGVSVSHDVNSVIMLRLQDVLLGSVVAWLGGLVLYRRSLYDAMEQRILQWRANQKLRKD